MTAHIDAPRSKCPACREKDGLMPDPTVTIATVTQTYAPGGDDPTPSYFMVTVQRGDPLPRVGDRVAVAGSVDAIFGWMDSLPAKRVVDAAREWAEWADTVDRFRGVAPKESMGQHARALYDAVRAMGAPSGEPAVTGYDAGDPRGDRTARVFIVNVGPEDEWLLHTGDRLILSPAGDVSVVIAQEAR